MKVRSLPDFKSNQIVLDYVKEQPLRLSLAKRVKKFRKKLAVFRACPTNARNLNADFEEERAINKMCLHKIEPNCADSKVLHRLNISSHGCFFAGGKSQGNLELAFSFRKSHQLEVQEPKC